MPPLHDVERRKLIAQAYDAELLRDAGQSIIQQLGDHLREVHDGRGPVHPWCDPEENIRRAGAWLQSDQSSHRSHADLVRHLEQLAETSLARGQNLHHPHYIGHQVPAPVPLAGLFDAAMAVTNQVQGVYEMGPWAVSVERAVVDRLGERIGFAKGEFSGLVTSGGSLANLTALLTARNLKLSESWSRGVGAGESGAPPVLVTHREAHYCVDRTAGILGLGTDQVLRVDLDDQRRMDPAELRSVLARCERQGSPVVAVIAVAGATPTGAYDPLEEIADICQQHGVWMHVDAAHGGAACFSRQHRHLVRGLSRADSVVFDAHKMMFMPALCAVVLYKNARDRFATFQQSAPYLFDPSAPGMAEYDNAMVTIECTKRAAALGLWAVWSTFGDPLFEALVDEVFETAQTLHQLIEASDDFEAYCRPTANIVVFRFLPPGHENKTPEALDELQLAARRRVLQSGEVYLTQTRLEGRVYLRCTIMNPLTERRHLVASLEALRYGDQ